MNERAVNTYDVLRLLAAGAVLVSHSFALTGHAEPAVPGTWDTLGWDAVLVFFALSGMLITQSWRSDPDLVRFARRRALRILPGLLVCNLLVAFGLGLALSSLSPVAYLKNLGAYKYVFGNTLMYTYTDLPGVFTGQPVQTVNGSLHTLPVEVKAYAFVALVGVTLLTRRLRWRLVSVLVLALYTVLAFTTGVKPTDVLVELFAVFAAGAALELLRSRVSLHAGWFAAGLALWVASYHVPWALHVLGVALTVPYLTYWLGHRGLGGLRVLTRPGDVSYGLYIYAFPVQQGIVAVAGPGVSPWLVMLGSAPLVYLLAVVSWRLVERPALRLKPRRPVEPDRVLVVPEAAPVRRTGAASHRN